MGLMKITFSIKMFTIENKRINSIDMEEFEPCMNFRYIDGDVAGCAEVEEGELSGAWKGVLYHDPFVQVHIGLR
jgi:hypothetical protein